MIEGHSVTGLAWIQITQPGQSGTCWLTKGGVVGNGDCVVFHTTGTPQVSDIELSYPVYEPLGQKKFEIISADGDSDVWYAIVDDVKGTCKIVTDVI